MLVSNQKSGNTQAKVSLCQLRHMQGIPFTFCHFTISVVQAIVASARLMMNVCVPRSQDTSMLAIHRPLRKAESEI